MPGSFFATFFTKKVGESKKRPKRGVFYCKGLLMVKFYLVVVLVVLMVLVEIKHVLEKVQIVYMV